MLRRVIAFFVIVMLPALLISCSFPADDDSDLYKPGGDGNNNHDKWEEENSTEINERALEDKVILIDAGHGKASYSKKEPIAPGSDEMKAAFAVGTTGRNQTEAELNLKVAKKLQAKLEEKGTKVHMTRTSENCDMTNIDRAQMGNKLNADISIRIHANGNEDKSIYGMLTMVPGNKYVSEEVASESYEAGALIQKNMLRQTSAKDAGIQKHDDMTGFNWSEVPVVLVEMGFMTNSVEDMLLEQDYYQDKIVQGIVDGLAEYFS